MRKFLAIALMASAAAVLAACTDQPPSSISSGAANSLAYERPGQVTRAPLAPPSGYASPPPLGAPSGYGTAYASPTPLGAPSGYGSASAPPPPLGAPYGAPQARGSYANSAQAEADPQTAPLGWHASPRWSAVQGDGCIEVEQGGEGGQMKIDRCAKQQATNQPPAPAANLVPQGY